MNRHRLSVRVALPIAALAGVLVLAGPAAAHVQVESDTPQALAANAVVSFDAEGESSSAGISKIRVVLPSGLAPGDVELADGPKGWTLTATEDGYTVGGAALAPGKSAAYKIKVKQLPDAKELVFKSLVTYSDGHIDRWIELPQGSSKPAHPAPVLTLTAAAPTVSAAPSSPAPASPSAAPSTAPVAADDGSSGDGPIVIGLVAALLVLVGAVVWWRRRSSEND